MNLYYKPGSELKHHGIKGQKWGVRRFQNKDGTLTPAGRKRKMTWREKRQAKKDVKNLYKALGKNNVIDQGLATMATYSKLNGKEDFEAAYDAQRKGKIVAVTRYVKNYEERSVDVYLNNFDEPVIRTRLKNGKELAYEIIDDKGKQTYKDFMEYSDNRRNQEKRLIERQNELINEGLTTLNKKYEKYGNINDDPKVYERYMNEFLELHDKASKQANEEVLGE